MAEADPQTIFNIHEAKTQFSRLVDRAHAGEEIVVAKGGEPWAKLVPITPPVRARRVPGRYAHLLKDVPSELFLEPSFTREELDAMDAKSLFPLES